ncbi:scavenger receptor cysteine-rich domain-containing protein DMBT1-like [Diadema antillarum]|uniref:scavenger receptor cysteine-rich domain-containing protein DMBT1-like n=1 Tax=Diadema antillarum TaxID=105358 RepID=UPI003A83A677
MKKKVVCVMVFIVMAVHACHAVDVGDTIPTPYCGGFLLLHTQTPSYRLQAPKVPIGFAEADGSCTWHFHALPGAVIKVDIIDLDLRKNESLRLYDGHKSLLGVGVDAKYLDNGEFISKSSSLSLRLSSGPVFEGTAIILVSLQTVTSARKVNLLSADPSQCGGTITLDYGTQTKRFQANNHQPGGNPAYCMWHIVAPSSMVVKLHFVQILLELYDNFVVVDATGARLAEFYHIDATPHEVISDSNQMTCLFAASAVQSSSSIDIEVTFQEMTSTFDPNVTHALSGGHINLTASTPSFTFLSNDFSTMTSVYVGSYWYVTSPPGTRIKIEFLSVDTGSGVFLDIRSGFNTPLTSLSGTLSLDPVITLDNSLVIWLYSQWRNPGRGVTIKVSLAGHETLDPTAVLSSCGGSVSLDLGNYQSIPFSSPNYGSTLRQYTVCYWYFASPSNTRIELQYDDIQTENGYVYIFDSLNSPSVTVSSISGEGVLQPFHSSTNGLTILYNDLADSQNGRGLLARATVIAADTPRPESSCGGLLALDTMTSSSALKTPWYDTPVGIMAYTTCYWYITSLTDEEVSLEFFDLQTVDAVVEVFDSGTSLHNQLATLKGDSASNQFLSSANGLTIVFTDFPSTSYTERGFSASVNLADKFSWDQTTVMSSCGGTVTFEPSSTSLTFSTPFYPNNSPDGYFDCRWSFSGPHDMTFVLEVEDFDTSQATYFFAFDSEAVSTSKLISELSGSDITTTMMSSEGALSARFYDSSMTDSARGIRAKVTLADPPSWSDMGTLDSCGGGVGLNFDTRSFLFTTPDYPSTLGNHYDCRWFVTSPSDTVILVEFIDFETDPNSYLIVHDGNSLSDREILRASGTTLPTAANSSANAMTLQFYSNWASSGRGASLVVTVVGGDKPTSDVRLVGGSGPHEGRVEVYYNHVWGTVCDDQWGVEDATVVCRMLGYRTVIAAWSHAHFGPGTGQIWLDDLQCTGDEDHITSCTHRMPTGSNNCGHSEDAGVTCGEGAQIICDSNSMTVLVDRVLLAPGDGAGDVYLVDESCRGYDHDSVKVAVSTTFGHCGTKMEETESTFTFSNVVTYFVPKSLGGETITREEIAHVPVSCTFNRHTILGGSSFQPQVGVVSFSETGYGNFSLELALYADESFDSQNQPAEDTKIPLGESVFFGVNLTAVTDLTLLIESCWATPHPYPFDPSKYLIIDNGCAVDSTVQFYDDVIRNPLFSSFSVASFSFVGDNEQVFMHCQVVVCDNEDPGSRCEQGCVGTAGRGKRALGAGSRGASSLPHTISNGPLTPEGSSRKQEHGLTSSEAHSENNGDVRQMFLVGISGILLAAGSMMAYITLKKDRRSAGYRRLPTKELDEGV